MNGRAARILRIAAKSTYGKLQKDAQAANRPPLPPFKSFFRRYKARYNGLDRNRKAAATHVFRQLVFRPVIAVPQYTGLAPMHTSPVTAVSPQE